MNRFSRGSRLPLLGPVAALLLCSAAPVFAQTWVGYSSADWNTAANWNPATVPNSSTAAAVFGNSMVTSVSISAATQVNSIVFNSGAGAFSIAVGSYYSTLTFSGAGITNNSGITQNFLTYPNFVGGAIVFNGSASAGSNTVFTNVSSASPDAGGGYTAFYNNSTAGNGVFINNGGQHGGNTSFSENSTAGNATLIANGSPSGGLVNYGGFGGGIYFAGQSTGGTASVTVNGNGFLDISNLTVPSLTVGSVAGNGNIFLGSNNLTVGSNNLSATFSGVLQDGGQYGGIGGSLTKIGAGILTLTGSNTCTGGTIVNAGTLQIGDGVTAGASIAPSGTVQVNAAGTLAINLASGSTFANAVSLNATTANLYAIQSGTNTLSGVISGAGTLNQTGKGATILTITETYTGATTVTSGTLSLGPAGSIAAGSTVEVHTAGALNFAAGGNVFGNATLTGGATVTGSGGTIGGTLGVTGGNWNATSGTVIGLVKASSAADTFTIGKGANLTATAGVNVTGGQIAGPGTLTGSLSYTSAQSSAFGGVIADGASPSTVTVNNGATILALAGANTYTGDTKVTSGTLSLGPTGSIAAGGTVGVDIAGALNFAGGGTVAGNATLTGGATVTGSGGTIGGTLKITGGNWNATSGAVTGLITATGDASTFTMGSGANLTAKAGVNLTGGQIAGTGTLTGSLNDTSAQSSTLAGAIADGANPSALTVNNAATTLTLTGASSFTGGTTLQAGTLVVLNSGALGGGNVTINGGALQAGGANTVIKVGGNYAQGSGGTLSLRVGGTVAGAFDQLVVTGRASLSGQLIVSSINGFVPANGLSLAVITAGSGVNGQFQNVAGNLANYPMIKLALTYLPNELLLGFTQASFLNVPTPAAAAAMEAGAPVMAPAAMGLHLPEYPFMLLTPDEKAVALALDHLASNPASVKLLTFLDSLPVQNLPGAYDLIGASAYGAAFQLSRSSTKAEAATIENRLDEIHVMLAPTVAPGPSGPPDDKGSKDVMPPPDSRMGFFSNGSGQFVNVGDTSNAKGYNFGSGSATVGVDYRLTEHLVTGALFEYAGSTVDLAGSGRLNANSFHGGAYASAFDGGAYGNGFLGGAGNDYDVRRPGLGSFARGSTTGGDFNALVTTGYDFHARGFTYGPVASFQYTHTGVDSFNEIGSLAPLHVNASSGDSLLINVGARVTYEWHIGKLVLVPEVRATWQHEYDNTYDETSATMLLGGPTFKVASAAIGRDSLVVHTGFALRVTRDLSLYAYYDGELARTNYQENNVMVGFRVSF